MKYYAHIENTLILEVIHIPSGFSLDTMYPVSFVEKCTPCSADVQPGWIWDEQAKTAYPPSEPKAGLEENRENAQETLRNKHTEIEHDDSELNGQHQNSDKKDEPCLNSAGQLLDSEIPASGSVQCVSASTAATAPLVPRPALNAPADSPAATYSEQRAEVETSTTDSATPVKSVSLPDCLAAARRIEKDVLTQRVMAEASLHTALLLEQQQAIINAVQAIIMDTRLAHAEKMEALEQLDTTIALPTQFAPLHETTTRE